MFAYAEVSCTGAERQIEDCTLTHGHRFDPCTSDDATGVICSFDTLGSDSKLDDEDEITRPSGV